MNGNGVSLVVDDMATLGEGPCWDAKRQRLYWVDIPEGKLHMYEPERQYHESVVVGEYVSSVAIRETGGLILTKRDGFYFYDETNNTLTFITDPESHLPNNRFNDGKVDPAGRYWAGTMEYDGKENAGSLYCLNTDLNLRKVKEHVSISNGIAWSIDHRTMYYIDSPTKQVVAYDYDIETGEINGERVIVQIPDHEGVPDGMTIDVEGMLWIAQWGGYKVSRWNPRNGKLLDIVPVPAAHVTSCVFGGRHLTDLYITTAREGLSEQELADYPSSGGVFCVNTHTKGLPLYEFKG